MSQQNHRLPTVQGVKKEDTSIAGWDAESMFYPPQHDFGKGNGDDRMSGKAYEGEDDMIGWSFKRVYGNVGQDYHRRTDAAIETIPTGVNATDAHVGEDQDSFSIKFSLSQEYKDDASFAEYCGVGPCHSMFPSPLPLHGTETFDFGENDSPLPMLHLSTTPSPRRGKNVLEGTTTDLVDENKMSKSLRDSYTIDDRVNRSSKLHPRRYHMDLVQSYSSDDFSPPREKRIPFHTNTTPIHAGTPTQHHSRGTTIYNIASTSVDSPQFPYQPIPWRDPSSRHSSSLNNGQSAVSPSESYVAIKPSPEFYPPRGYTRGQNRSVHETMITVNDQKIETHFNVDPATPSLSQIRQAVSDETTSPTLAPTVHHPSRHPVVPTSSSEWSSSSPYSQSHHAPWNGHNLPPALPSSDQVYESTDISPYYSPYLHTQSTAHKHGAILHDPRHCSEEAHWGKHQHLLYQFLLHFGHCNVPAGYGVGTHYEGLYQWCMDQRTKYQKMCRDNGSRERNSMTPERVRILTGMGFVWGHSPSTFRQSSAPSNPCGTDVTPSKSYSSWGRWLELLSEYKQQHGDVDVPLKYEPNPSLGTFVNRQRTEYRKMQSGKPSCLTLERVDELNRLGFTWTVQESQTSWEDRFSELKDFKKMSGHCNVPKIYAKNPSLGYWVNEQRFQYRRKIKGQSNCMTDDKVKALNELEFKVSDTINPFI